MYDFPDFYCGGRVLDRGASPYTYEPLHTCEREVNVNGAFRSDFFRRSPAIAIPAPLPPYAFVPYMALAGAPAGTAATVQLIAIVGAIALCVLGLRSLRVSLVAAAAALALSGAYMELNSGQVVPFALLALIACGVALYRRNDRLAGVCAALTLIEPSVGLAACVATLLFVSRARVALAASACALIALAIGLVGFPVLVVYVTSVLPAQAASEVHFPYQYSLTYLLATAGTPAPAARMFGELSYFAMLAVGLVAARPIAHRFERRDLLVFFPALCTVVGGTYLHAEELCFAVPAMLVLATVSAGIHRTLFALCAAVLAVPWILVWGEKQLFAPSILVCAAILLSVPHQRLRVTFAGLALIAAIVYAFEIRPPSLPVPVVSTRTYEGSELVQQEWRDYAQSRATADARWLAIKIPTWVALLGAVGLALYDGKAGRGMNSRAAL